MDGVLVIDKPAGMTSHDVVDEIRHRLRTRKVGHGGTLDPDATGVLLVGVGRATRLLSFAQAGPKHYTVRARFGSETSTQDASGDVSATFDASGLAAADVDAALRALTGEIDQVPPMVSAVKVGGERLYRKARRGEDVERPARRVTVYALDLVEFVPGDEPEAVLDVECSGGTYVRTLVHDLGRALGVGAHLRTLRRIEAGGFTEAEAIPLEDADAERLRPLGDAVRSLVRVEVSPDDAAAVAHGRALDLHADVDDGAPVAITSSGRLLAIYRRAGERLLADRVVTG